MADYLSLEFLRYWQNWLYWRMDDAMPKLSIKWGQPSDQPGHGGPKSEEIISVLERARLAPNGQADLSWQDPRSNERFVLKVQKSEGGHEPSWYLTCQPSWSENIALWSVCSSDLKLVDEALRVYTSHEVRLGQLVQTHAQVISTSKAPAVQITPTGQVVPTSVPHTEVKVGLTDTQLPTTNLAQMFKSVIFFARQSW
jgi:hypothetical protein